MVKIECEKCDKFSTTVEGDGLFEMKMNMKYCKLYSVEGDGWGGSLAPGAANCLLFPPHPGNWDPPLLYHPTGDWQGGSTTMYIPYTIYHIPYIYIYYI